MAFRTSLLASENLATICRRLGGVNSYAGAHFRIGGRKLKLRPHLFELLFFLRLFFVKVEVSEVIRLGVASNDTDVVSQGLLLQEFLG